MHVYISKTEDGMIGWVENKFGLKLISAFLLIGFCIDFHYFNLKGLLSLFFEYITVILGIQQLLGKCSKT